MDAEPPVPGVLTTNSTGGQTVNTLIEYMYRDASNFKFHERVVVAGELTMDDLRPHLDEEEYFIPEDVGLSHCRPHHHTYSEDDDHPWHELEGTEPTNSEPDGGLTAEELIRAFARAAEQEWPGQHADISW
jgi:hypothetical protein